MRYFMGYDTKESEAFSVALHSIRAQQRFDSHYPVRGLHLPTLRDAGLYTRPTSMRDGRLWDDISGAYMSTEHANSRFLVPLIAKTGWALFTDCDILLRRPIADIMEQALAKYAVMVVKHDYAPVQKMKMTGQPQQLYARKNWSSVMLFNCDHPANQGLTLEMVNTLPGRDLHRFCWLQDHEIGALTPDWNWLVGHSDPGIAPAIVHFTEGLPSMPGYEDCAYASDWRAARVEWLGAANLKSL